MQTKILNSIDGDYDYAVNAASEILKNGGIVAIPTETVYGLAASAYSDSAIKAVFAAKGRPQDNPLIVHISDLDMLSLAARDIPDTAYECAKRFWPGPFTMVLPKGDRISNSASGGLDTVAVRMPSEKTAHDIIKTSGIPIAAPSANTSGMPSPTTAQHVINDLNGKIDAVVIGNDCTVGIESTVVSLTGEKPRLLRPGAVTAEMLKEVFLLIDIRHAPSENDRIMYDWIRRNGYDPIIIATKLDKINRSQIQKQVKLIRTTLQAGADTQIVPYSAQTKQGREEIYEILDGVLAAEDPAQE